MNSLVKPLLILLVAQLLLWGFFIVSGSGEKVAAAPALLSVEVGATKNLSIEIEDADGKLVRLSRIDAGWQLPSGLPADSAKVEALLTKLQSLNLRWPVSTNTSSHERFEVAADNFQRRVALSGDGLDATLFFGTSPGYQQVHARSSDDAVYAVKLANYELPATADDWLDKSLLQAKGEVSRATWNEEVTVVKDSEGWMLAGELANIEATDRAVSSVAQLQVLGVLDSAPSAAPADAQVVLLSDSDGDYRLSFWPREANNDHVVMSTRFPAEAFRIANYVAEQLVPDAASLAAPKLPQIDLQDLGLESELDPDIEGAGAEAAEPRSSAVDS